MGGDHPRDVNGQLEMMTQYMFIGLEPAPLNRSLIGQPEPRDDKLHTQHP